MELESTSTSITPSADAVSQLYASGKSIVQVASELGITYGKARNLLRDSGTPLRDASARLKGRTGGKREVK